MDKKTLAKQQFRLNEFFEDFNPTDVLNKEYEEELLERTTKVICLRIYEFCFGTGRQVRLSGEFKAFIRSVHENMEAVKITHTDDILAQKAAINELIRLKFIDGGRVTNWRGMYESEWFSDNEKFHLSLALVRLLGEVESFAGEPRDLSVLSDLCDQGQSIEHTFFYGPNMILGERALSQGGKAGRRPLLASRLLRTRNEQQSSSSDEGGANNPAGNPT